MSILKGVSITKEFGGLTALNKINFELKENKILGIIGPNGAGKTTLINIVSGIYPPSSGEMIFDGKNITGLPAHLRCRIGIGRTFQIIRPLQDLNLLENIMVGSLFGQGTKKKEARKEALNVCDFMRLSQVERQVGKLTVLEIKKMEIARALLTGPKILFLDEVIAGLNVDETNEMIGLVQKIKDQDVTICIIEHVMRIIKELTDRVIVLNKGEIIARGPYEKVSSNPEVLSAYLGEEE